MHREIVRRFHISLVHSGRLPLIAVVAVIIAMVIQLRSAHADEGGPTGACTGTCALYLPGQPPQFFDCDDEAAPKCCCDIYTFETGWLKKCCPIITLPDAPFPTQNSSCTVIIDAATGLPKPECIANLANGGGGCIGCDDLGIQ